MTAEVWGAHAPSCTRFGALAKNTVSMSSPTDLPNSIKVSEREGAIASTRGACLPRKQLGGQFELFAGDAP
jgi:hypothetical protein